MISSNVSGESSSTLMNHVKSYKYLILTIFSLCVVGFFFSQNGISTQSQTVSTGVSINDFQQFAIAQNKALTVKILNKSNLPFHCN